MVGLSLALQLSRSLPAATTITLVESVPLPSSAAGSPPTYHPSFDARSTALSYSSRAIYRAMGLWDGLAQWACPIETIHVSNRGRFGSSLLRAGDYQWPALGYVVENAWLGRYLLHALQSEGRVELVTPARVTAAVPAAAGMSLQLDHDGIDTLQAGLLVVADGAGSALRDSLGVVAGEKPYGQHALVANVAFARNHQGCAYERFTDQGPLALLPLLPADGAPHRAALVWTLPQPSAARYRDCEEPEFLAALQDRFGYRLGRLTQVGERFSYPLSLLQSEEQVRQGVVIMGNAAHALHPVAGQGFNLALRDVAALAETLAGAAAAGRAPGELAVLQDYERRQRADQALTIQMSDLLPQLFMRSDPILGMTRDMALSGLDVLAPLKRQFVRQAAGMAALGASKGSGIRVALVEAQPLRPAELPEALDLGHFDPRVSALTPRSIAFLDQLGAWDAIAGYRSCPYRHMTVWEADGTATIDFDAAEVDAASLGTIVENRAITNALLQRLQQQGGTALLAPARLAGCEAAAGGGVAVTLEDGLALEAALLVAADGALSRVRELMGFQTREWDYGHRAIVTTVSLQHPHQDTAWQCFMPTGPLALLPLPSGDGQYFCSIVWSQQEDAAEALLALDDEAFCDALGRASEFRLGRVLGTAQRFAFPLRQRHAVDYVMPGVALVGDAAHTIHPLAGQGINLGLSDVAVLAGEIRTAVDRGQSAGELSVLKRYQRQRKGENLAMMAAMDGFKRLFEQRAPAVRWLRNAGLRGVGRLLPLKQQLMRQAMGLGVGDGAG